MESEGRLYHVINRGNYRADGFGTEGAKQALEKALSEELAHGDTTTHPTSMSVRQPSHLRNA